MRGDDQQQAGMFSYISPEQRVPADHPLRPIRKMTDEIFKQLSPRFAGLYARVGRPSTPPPPTTWYGSETWCWSRERLRPTARS